MHSRQGSCQSFYSCFHPLGAQANSLLSGLGTEWNLQAITKSWNSGGGPRRLPRLDLQAIVKTSEAFTLALAVSTILPSNMRQLGIAKHLVGIKPTSSRVIKNQSQIPIVNFDTEVYGNWT